MATFTVPPRPHAARAPVFHIRWMLQPSASISATPAWAATKAFARARVDAVDPLSKRRTASHPAPGSSASRARTSDSVVSHRSLNAMTATLLPDIVRTVPAAPVNRRE